MPSLTENDLQNLSKKNSETNFVLRKLFIWLFGGCRHNWSKWRENFAGSSFQCRECSICGKRQEKMIYRW
jgi:hypothetical protein